LARRANRSDSMWAISGYFDPVGSKYRLENYRTFAQALDIPLLTVELAFDNRFALGASDADILIQLNDGDIMWQQIRLFNMGLQHLPSCCNEVVMLDCDERPGWSRSVKDLLTQYPLVQPFQIACDLAPCSQSVAPAARAVVLESPGAGYCLHTNSLPPDCFRRTSGREKGKIAMGLAWAARRQVLQDHQFYDACILGSGDRAMLSAALGRFDEAIEAIHMNEARARHYLAWAHPFFKEIGGRIGYAEGKLHHLWHGDFASRLSGVRHQMFQKFNFDPNLDIRPGDGGAWCWNSDKKDMHRFLTDYFTHREAPGEPTTHPGHGDGRDTPHARPESV
jgi:hypothetical protein